MKKITSIQNAYIKDLLKLQDKSRERRKKGLFLVEGKREITLITKGNYTIDTILYVADLLPENELQNLKQQTTSLIEITKDIYNLRCGLSII